jgi:K+-sensing histidine kinase KdpD
METESEQPRQSFFASPQRSSDEQIKNEHLMFIAEKPFIDILAAISGIVIVLNENRQIIYANEECLKALGLDSVQKALGLRPGEALGCIHAHEMPAGCGTSESCSVCGAVTSILQSQAGTVKAQNETRLTTSAGDFQVCWDMMVTSSPVSIEGREFYVLSLNDISHEKRRQSLEKIFFHDILNTAGSLKGLISMLKGMNSVNESKEIVDMSEEAVKELIEEIMHHKQIRSAENGDLIVNFDLEQASEMLRLAVGKIEHHIVGEGKSIISDDRSEKLIIETDRVLLQRILINMLKNALEATGAGKTVNAAVIKKPESVVFSVRNEAVIPKDVRMQIFQRSFSTKGKGRGIGTYSIKLLTENYLRGQAGFHSNEEEGTVFFIELPVKVNRENT